MNQSPDEQANMWRSMKADHRLYTTLHIYCGTLVQRLWRARKLRLKRKNLVLRNLGTDSLSLDQELNRLE